MGRAKRWMVFPVLVTGLGVMALSCSSESDKTSSRPTETARPAVPPAPGSGVGGPSTTATAPKETAGEVVSANPAGKMLVVKSVTGEMTFEVKDSAANDLATLKPGDKVTVQYTEANGRYTAEMVRKG